MSYPVMLSVKKKRCLVAGGGKVAERKIISLLKAGADVRVVSPKLTGTLAALAGFKLGFKHIKRTFKPGDLEEAFLVIAATDDKKVNSGICLLASKKGILCNSVNTRAHTSFMNMAAKKVNGLTIAVSSLGQNVKMAKAALLGLKIRKG
jgi:precorrin-2 dehydrogenase/sirohydrochlorin ferrochelatase